MSVARLIEAMPRPVMRWRWVLMPDGGRVRDVSVSHEGGRLVGFDYSGPYDADAVLDRIVEVLARKRKRRSEAAKRGAATRSARRERRVYEIAKAVLSRSVSPASRCYLCGRGLTDEQSRRRGVGPECWGDVLRAVERLASGSQVVGRFRCDGGGLAVGDPCYLSDPRLSLRLKDAKAGFWIVTACHRRFDDDGERVVSVTVSHESATGVPGPWRDSGAAIGVDTGHVAVCDARSLIGPDHAPVRSAVVLDRGVLSAAGFGDWIYPCFIQESGGEIVGVEIRFIDESEGGDA